MTGPVRIAELLDQERERAKREAKPTETADQRARRRLLGRFHDSLRRVWDDAHLLTDEEFEAAKAKGTRKYRRWSGWTEQVVRATNYDDAARLDGMQTELSRRHWKHERQQGTANRRKVTAALRRLGLPVPDQVAAEIALWTAIDGEDADGAEASP